MGFDMNLNKVTRPVRMSDVRIALGDSSVSIANTEKKLSDLCTDSRINKWSKRKPIAYPQANSLTDAQFAGHPNQTSAGIIYGLQCGIGSTGQLRLLHNCDYAYIKPTNYYRLGDFEGYRSNARPNIQGMSNLSDGMINPATQNLTLNLNISSSNSDFVTLNDLLSAVSATSVTLEEFYPAVLIGNYAHVLYNGSQSTLRPTITRVKQNGVIHNQFYIPLNESSTPSAVKTAGTKQVTFFLIEKYTCSQYNIGSWLQVGGTPSGDAMLPNLGLAFAIPEMASMTMTVGTGSENKVLVDGIFAFPAARNGIQATFSSNSIPASQACTFTASCRYGSTTRSKTVTKAAGTQWSNMVSTTWDWTEFGLVSGSYPSNQFSITVSTTYNGAASHSKTQQFDWTT